MKFKIGLSAFLLLAWLAPWNSLYAYQPEGEVSAMMSYSKTDYGNNSYSTTRRYMFAAALNVTPATQVELSFTNTDTFLNYDPVQTATVQEQVLALSAVQALVPPEFIVQPYGKAGFAQYNRKRTGTTYGVPDRDVYTKDPSVVLGGGVKIFLLRQFSLKVEAVTYLPKFKFGGATDNYSIQGGVGWHF